MTETRHCSECGAALPAEQSGLCPACLFRIGLEAPETPEAPGDELPPPVGPYKPVGLLGRGGMGMVYLARQDEPIGRDVALKIIRPGFDSREVIARFDAERRTLALMDHPGIARVIDAGAMDSGRPFFVLEYVDGIPVTDFCDRHRLDTRRRVELFLSICRAVQHAHQKGIIHRDLKPSNVLVAGGAADPASKIIDFGVAKATAHSLTDETLQTRVGQVIGTPEYMSPEQARGAGLDLDTRSDVYSLGVLLYELLVGALPFDPELLRDAGLTEMIRTIEEVEPPRPSLRVSSLGAAASAAADRRRTEPRRLVGTLIDDLDWIVMKAIEKDPARRYASASELAADLERYLVGDVVLAGPPSTWYRVRRFAGRHRLTVGFSAALLVILVGFLLAISFQAHRIADERDRANREAQHAEQVADFLSRLFRESDPRWSEGSNTSIGAALAVGRERIETELADQPAVRARLLTIIGNAYRNLGDLAAAGPLLEEALEIDLEVLGERDPETAAARNSLALLREDQGRYEEAAALQEAALAMRLDVLGRHHVQTLYSMTGLGNLYRLMGRPDEAEPLLSEAVDNAVVSMGESHPRTLEFRAILASLWASQGRIEEAAATYDEVVEDQRTLLGDTHPVTLGTINDLATVRIEQGRVEEAERLYREALDRQKETLGERHPQTLRTMNNLGSLYMDLRRYVAAGELFDRALLAHRATLGEGHPHALSVLNNRAALYFYQRRLDDAGAAYVRVVDGRRRVLGGDHPDTLKAANSLAVVYRTMGRFAEAEELFRSTLDAREQTLGPEHPDTLTSRSSLGLLYRRQGKGDEAEPLLMAAMQGRRRALGPSHRQTVRATVNVVSMLLEQGRRDEALNVLEEAVEAGLSPSTLAEHPALVPLRDDPRFREVAGADQPETSANR